MIHHEASETYGSLYEITTITGDASQIIETKTAVLKLYYLYSVSTIMETGPFWACGKPGFIAAPAPAPGLLQNLWPRPSPRLPLKHHRASPSLRSHWPHREALNHVLMCCFFSEHQIILTIL